MLGGRHNRPGRPILILALCFSCVEDALSRSVTEPSFESLPLQGQGQRARIVYETEAEQEKSVELQSMIQPRDAIACADWCEGYQFNCSGLSAHENRELSSWSSKCTLVDECRDCAACAEPQPLPPRLHRFKLEALLRGDAVDVLNVTALKPSMRAHLGCFEPNCSLSLEVHRPHKDGIAYAPVALAAESRDFQQFKRQKQRHKSRVQTKNLIKQTIKNGKRYVHRNKADTRALALVSALFL